jgi:hypothetical protein
VRTPVTLRLTDLDAPPVTVSLDDIANDPAGGAARSA